MSEAKALYDKNMLPYHNWEHVQSMHQFLDDMSYRASDDLKKAIDWHDAVYDAFPGKAARSYEAYRKVHGPNPNVEAMIFATVDHLITEKMDEDVRMIIRADLHHLTDPRLTVKNYVKVMEESIDLYGISMAEFAVANSKFMVGLLTTTSLNSMVDDAFWEDFWIDCHDGAYLCKNLSETIITNS